ncbi:phosphorylase b kinase gamma catalytic chain [Stipitochalara longipes BDJ]|nr:phosphorylase b kinase gamma catalytic chain [Stipitochalara longipes BDJ]
MPDSAPESTIQPCRYKIGRTLGAGSYSVVKEAVHTDTNKYYAAKVINKRLIVGREHIVHNEISILKKISLGHPNVLTLVDHFETLHNIYIVTELALGGELFDRVVVKGSYYESDARDLVRGLCSGVAYLHGLGIVHRDLKPANLLFRTTEDGSDLLISDFGISTVIGEGNFYDLTTTCGTPGYMAPEIFRKTGYGKAVDMWAIGVITYFLLCGYSPFDRDSNLEEMRAILNAEFGFSPEEYWEGVSIQAKDFIRNLIVCHPQERLTAHQALSHDFLDERTALSDNKNLKPTFRENFNAERTLHSAIDTIKAINQLREKDRKAQIGEISSAVRDEGDEGSSKD